MMKEKDLAVLDGIQQTIQRCTRKPEHYLSVQTNIVPDLKRTTKDLYDLAFKKKSFTRAKSQALPELIVQDFDSEQIWQQLELENNEEFSQQGIEKLSKALASKKWVLPLRTSSLSDDEDASKTLESESEASENVDEASENEDDTSKERVSKKHTRHKNKNKGSVLDDKFFKIEELNRFLKMEDQKESGQGVEVDSEDEELEAIDLFNDIPDSEEEDDKMNGGSQSLKYADFFDKPSSENEEEEPSMENNMKSDGHEDDDDLGEGSDDDDDDDGPTDARNGHPLFEQSDSNDESSHHRAQSSLEKRKERLEKRIHQLEDQAVGDKPWQLKGEVSSKDRPVNSLLEEFVEFDQVTRPAPIMTEQTTMKLEDIIRNRIKDKAWDDVEKKIKPVETPMEYKKKLVMNQEKSKESLAQIYENEYIKQREALANNDKDEQPQEEPPEHNEIRELMHSLFVKLDALSNFHYTPKPAKPEIKIVSNVPAIHMEEVAPVATTDATLLAPEEIQSKQKGDLIGKSERTKTDMKRARRKKKLNQRERALNESKKSAEESAKQKTRPLAKTKGTKLKGRNIINMEDTSGGKAIKSSTAFFSQLQDQVSNSIKKKTSTSTKNKNTLSAVKLKL